MHLYRIATFTVFAATSLASTVARASFGEPKTLNFDDINVSIFGKPLTGYKGFDFRGFRAQKTSKNSVGLVPDSGMNTAVSSFLARLVYGSNKPAPNTLIDVEQLTQFSNFTVDFAGSEYKTFDVKSLFFGLVFDLPGGLVKVALEGDVRFLPYDADNKPLGGAGITQRFSPQIDPTTGKVKMDQIKFGSGFRGMSTLRITLLNVRIPKLTNAGRLSELVAAIAVDTIEAVAYPK